jgi:hypothetical protein
MKKAEVEVKVSVEQVLVYSTLTFPKTAGGPFSAFC